MVESNSQNKKQAIVGKTGMYGFDEREDNQPQQDFENSQPQSQFNQLSDFQYKYEPAQDLGLNSKLIQVRILHQEALYERNPRDDYYSELDHEYRRKDDDLDGEDMNDIQKFIKQKYFMFSRYDMGICLDRVGWFSLTPEPVAAFMASFVEDINEAIVVDCCCGVGGNIIQFARLPNVEQCYAIDLDQLRYKFARSNANKYKVGKKIFFQSGDFLELKVEKYFQDKLDSVVFFFDPPWGGLDYRGHAKFQIKDFLPYNFKDSLCKAFKYSVNIILKLPSNMDLDELYDTIIQCYCTTRNKNISDNGSEQLNIQTMIIKERIKLKYYMVLIGDKLNRKDLSKMRFWGELWVDCCCGVGGNIIQFARLPNVEQCYAIDLDQLRYKFARSNANKYKVGKKIFFQSGDFLELKVEKYFQDKLDSVVFFFDPPWGGLDYRGHAKFQIKDFLPYNFKDSLCKAFKYSVNIILKLPSNMDLDELYDTIIQCYCTTRNKNISDNGSEQLNIQTMIIKERIKLKYYMVLIGDKLNRKDLSKMSQYFSLPKHRKVEEVKQKVKAESKQSLPIPKIVTKVQNEQLEDDDYGVEHVKISKKKK
eukprot:403363865